MRLTAELTADRHHAFWMVWTYQTVPETARMTVNGATGCIVTIEGRTTGIGTENRGGKCRTATVTATSLCRTGEKALRFWIKVSVTCRQVTLCVMDGRMPVFGYSEYVKLMEKPPRACRPHGGAAWSGDHRGYSGIKRGVMPESAKERNCCRQQKARNAERFRLWIEYTLSQRLSGKEAYKYTGAVQNSLYRLTVRRMFPEGMEVKQQGQCPFGATALTNFH